jgi:hypothetical protein
MKINAELIYKKVINENTSILVTYNKYSNDYQIRLNYIDGIRYQNVSTFESATQVVKEYFTLANNLIVVN